MAKKSKTTKAEKTVEVEETKMICVRLPVSVAHKYKVNLRSENDTAQAHLSGTIMSFNEKCEKKNNSASSRKKAT